MMLDVGRSVDAASLSGFGHRVRQIVDPDGALADANRAHDRRWFTAAKTFNGLVSVEGLLDAEGGATVLTVLGRRIRSHRSGGHAQCRTATGRRPRRDVPSGVGPR